MRRLRGGNPLISLLYSDSASFPGPPASAIFRGLAVELGARASCTPDTETVCSEAAWLLQIKLSNACARLNPSAVDARGPELLHRFRNVRETSPFQILRDQAMAQI